MKRLWNWLTRKRPDRGWPGYIINGRIRTSTAVLIFAFFGISWLHSTYQPAAQPPAVPETAVVPPGFVPDPEYTWVPRTNVEERPRTTTRTPTTTTETPTTTPPTTTETSPDDTTSGTPTSPTTPTSPSNGAPTTVVDPDGAGPLPPTTIGPSTTVAPNAPGLPFPLPGITLPTPQPPR
ncbi:hypothetical protein GCM10023114_16050 [Mycolicibacterium sediminis]|uniref:Proline-rich protein n=1 Tax=Mycolicibacterium sediminis TaxID=1286180 RepID=A0A7I7QSN1_9MYCO|nr:hypothetical protein MSEDJ_29620 [Mycolicibacterium sediminis]